MTVTDDSHRHRGHAGARPEGETHYSVVVVSPAFAGMSRVARSRAVHAELEREFGAGLHALSLRLLTPEEADHLFRLLRVLAGEGKTVVLITHQMQVIKQIADRVAVIDGGEIAELGPVIDVFTRPQQAITRSLIDEIVPQQLPESVAVRVNALAAQLAPGQQGRLLRLSYAGESAYQPILSHLIRELGLDLSILHGQIDEIQEQTFGSLAVFASGDAAKIDAAVDHLRATGVQVQIVSTRD